MTEAVTAQRDASETKRAEPCADCFGRDVFAGSDPEATIAPPELQEEARRPLRRIVSEHRRLVALLAAALVITLFVVAVLPKITGLGATIHRLGRGSHTWLIVGVVLESLSIAGYVYIFRSVFSCEGTRIGWRASYEITLAGTVATKLLAAAGAGGIALTAWALRAAGLSGRTVTRRMAGFEVILYALFMLALVVAGLILGTGAFGEKAPWSVSYLPATFGAFVIGLAVAARFIPERLEHAVAQGAASRGRRGKFFSRLVAVPAALRDGMATAQDLLRHPTPGLLGAVAYWAFDIATLWASFRAFGVTVPVAVIVMGYYVGQLANAIPLPGGIGGVEGGMIGCFIALGVNASAAIVAVFAYRAISFWLPTLPGAVAYLQLRRRISRWRESEEREELAAAR